LDNNLETKGITVQVTDGTDCRKTLRIEVPHEILLAEKEKVLKSLARDVSIPGFRKGKAPKEIIQKRYSGEIHSEAVKSILPLAYGHALETESLHPIGDPLFRDIKSEEDKPLNFTVELETVPEIVLVEYKGLAGEPEKMEVGEEEVAKVLDNLLEREADFIPVERESAPGDMVMMDYVPLNEDGTADAEKMMSDYPVQLGAGQLFPEFEEALTGKKASEKGIAEINYPDDFKPERLAGLKVSYEFTVKEVREKIIPKLDDEFARKLGAQFAGVEDLKADARRRLLEEKEREARRRMEEDVIDRIIEKNPFDVPLSMVERFTKELQSEDERRREMAGVGPEEDADKKKEIDAFLDKVSRRNIKRFFLIDHVARVEKIEISDEDMNGEIERLAADGNRPVEEVRKLVARGSENYNNLRGRLREKKVFEVLSGR